jgi:hypothetical protein
LGFYNAVVVGAIYQINDSATYLKSPQSIWAAVKVCIERHPCLSAVVKDWETEKPFYERVSSLDLIKHIDIVQLEIDSDDDNEVIERILPTVLDRPWQAGIPRWRIVIKLQTAQRPPYADRIFVAFAFSHTLGDGISGFAFHRSFLSGLRDNIAAGRGLIPLDGDNVTIVQSPNAPIAAPFDTKARLPISWSYLLTPLLAVYLSKPIARFFGLRAAASVVDAGTWTGPNMFYDKANFHTGVSLLEIDAGLVNKLLRISRLHEAKLTAVLHGLILRALCKAIPANQGVDVTNFVSQTAVNMRRSIGASDDDMGLFVSGYYDMHDKIESPKALSDVASAQDFWASAKQMTMKISECAATLTDQPIGLLRYLPSIRSWTSGKVGQRRDGSYEVSNLGAFDATEIDMIDCLKITKMVFSQPASVPSAPIAFNFASIKGGCLVCVIDWQIGALGVSEAEEMPLVKGLCRSLKEDIEALPLQ